VRAFLSRFTEWYDFGHEVVAKVGDRLIPVPFNLNTLHLVYEPEKADRLEEKLIASYGEGSRVPIMQLRENDDPDVREIADYVYRNIFLYYTMKQWGQKPEEISPEVTGRVPVVISRDNRYFKDRYQGVPLHGFTPMFEAMLDYPGIEVRTGTDCREVLRFADDGIYFESVEFTGDLIYTGAIDELFDCRYGRLPYRSLDFRFEHLDCDSFQGRSVVNYTVSEDFTRITEFKFLTGQQDADGTTIVREYPFAYTGAEGETPYYAILEEQNEKLYEQYRKLTEGYPRFYLLGRLAEYKYYNIDAMCRKAMDLVEEIG
jgi:UDP-galactopyranose mutase